MPPDPESDPQIEKARIQRQERLKRDEQLALPSVRRFIADMERPREYQGRFVSIFDLMRQGPELAAALRDTLLEHEPTPEPLRAAVDPYIQVVTTSARCEYTGLRLLDIWRYFRHTWTNQYTTTPGRTLALLVRDRAARGHPVIGIAALGSAIMQIRERDEWLGWDPTRFLATLSRSPSREIARWLLDQLEQSRRALYLDDLVRDRLYWPSLWRAPTREAIERLVNEAKDRRNDHQRFARRSDFKWNVGEDDSWQSRAETDLFRSKRCTLLAELLDARAALLPHLGGRVTQRGLADALADRHGRRAIASIVRRAKADSAGTEIADLTVCGAIAPYNALLGGKLVSLLSVSPTVVRAYRDRYRTYASEIASSMAGRRVSRPSNLVFIGTTSLYGSGSSQYNRLSIAAGVVGNGDPIAFQVLGRSRSFGTSHLSAQSVDALVRLTEQTEGGIRVNSIFGEGVNPKLRKVRQAFEMLGWPSDELLRHRRQRIVYGVPLVSNLLPYLLGLQAKPRYVFDERMTDDVDRIASWWRRRWLAPRARSAAVLDIVASHSLDRPVHHGARVNLPSLADDNQ